MTYLEKMNSLASDDERYVFEMDHFSGPVIRSMVQRGQPRDGFYIARFEDLVTDGVRAAGPRASRTA